MMTYLVIQPDGQNAGYVISRHRSVDMARSAIDREQKRLRRQAGKANAYLERRIVESESTAAYIRLGDDGETWE